MEMSLATVGKDINDMASLRAGVMPEDLDKVARELGLAVVPRPDNKYIQTPGVWNLSWKKNSFPTTRGEHLYFFEGEEATVLSQSLKPGSPKIQWTCGLPMGVIRICALSSRRGRLQSLWKAKVPTVPDPQHCFSQDPQAIF